MGHGDVGQLVALVAARARGEGRMASVLPGLWETAWALALLSRRQA